MRFSPVSRRLPPFAAMRAFEAAARFSNFKLAAAELDVSPSAISHQVKALESHLGVRLFNRGDRGMRLTETGQNYLIGLRKGFDQLEAATLQVVERNMHGVISLLLYPTFAARWLIPRLSSFERAYPGIEVRLISTERPVELSSADVDLAIRHGTGNWPRQRRDFLLSEDLFPVCSPSYLETWPIFDPAQLGRHRLIHCRSRPDEWEQWLVAADVDPDEHLIHGLSHGLGLDSRMLSLQAALDGLGIAIGRRPLVDDDLAAGRLVAPFETCLTTGDSYYLVCPEHTARLPKVVAFRGWLLEQCQQA